MGSTIEIWKDIVDYEGLYQISNLSRIRSLDRRINHKNNHTIIRKGKVIKPVLGNRGYLKFLLSKDNKQKAQLLHRIVAQYFIPNPENKSEVNHIDGDKTNCRIENLEWVTPSENSIHGFALDLKPRGENHFKTKLTNEQVKEIKFGHIGLNQAEIAKLYDVKPNTISQIKTGRKWKHINK